MWCKIQLCPTSRFSKEMLQLDGKLSATTPNCVHESAMHANWAEQAGSTTARNEMKENLAHSSDLRKNAEINYVQHSRLIFATDLCPCSLKRWDDCLRSPIAKDLSKVGWWCELVRWEMRSGMRRRVGDWESGDGEGALLYTARSPGSSRFIHSLVWYPCDTWPILKWYLGDSQAGIASHA